MDKVQISQVKPGDSAASMHLGKWFCTKKDYTGTSYLQQHGSWGHTVFYFNSDSEIKRMLERHSPSSSFSESSHSHDDDDSSSSFGLGSIGGGLSIGGSDPGFFGGGGDFGGGGAGGDW